MTTTRSFKLSVLGITVLAFSLGCSSSQPTRTTHHNSTQATPAVADASFKTDKAPIDGSVALLSVSGLGCPLCANNVDEKLTAVAGVRDVEVDLGTGTVTVALAESLRPSRADLARAVEDSGFTLTAMSVR